LSNHQLSIYHRTTGMGAVFELPGGGGVEPPSCLLNPPPPKQDAPGYPGGVSFNPPVVVNDAESPVCNDSDNEQADVNPPLIF
jgi:hypothetical protein